jgi:hypothetical protein
MIMDLATELICCTPNIDYKEAKEIASKMLNRAEENGMLPPENWYTDIHYNNEWEDED